MAGKLPPTDDEHFDLLWAIGESPRSRAFVPHPPPRCIRGCSSRGLVGRHNAKLVLALEGPGAHRRTRALGFEAHLHTFDS